MYPAFRREVFFISKKYRYLASVKKSVKIDYFEIEIEHEIPSFVQLPGNVVCGNVKSYRVLCMDCGIERNYVFGGCDDPKCFICHVAWCKQKAYDDALRVMAGLERVKKENGELWHFVLSPPENAGDRTTPVNEDWIEEIIKECYELCKKNGIRGGCAIIHYGPELDDEGVEKYLPSGEYRPHVHVLGFGKRPKGPWKNDRGEWVCKTLNDGIAVERDFDFIRDGLHYRLSHAMRRKHHQSIRWFGCWSYRMRLGKRDKLVLLGIEKKWIEKMERSGREVICKCPKCGGEMVKKVIYDSNGGYFVDIKGPP